MANKNTKQLRVKIRRACKRGEETYITKDGKVFPTSRLKGDTVSQNRKRNTAMRVYKNTDANGRKCSLTVHEPMLKGEFMTFKNHKEYKDFNYRQPSLASV
jgi:hypothetical protein